MLPVTVLLTKLETQRDVVNDDLKTWQNLLQVLQKKSSRCAFNDDRIAGLGVLSPKRRTLQVDMKQSLVTRRNLCL